MVSARKVPVALEKRLKQKLDMLIEKKNVIRKKEESTEGRLIPLSFWRRLIKI